MYTDKPFTKENLDSYLKELAKEFRKKNGTRMPAEIKNQKMSNGAIIIKYVKSCKNLMIKTVNAALIFS